MIGGLGMQELVIILLIVLLLFGGRKIPEIAKGLGKGIREFKNASRETKEELEKPDDGGKKQLNGKNEKA